MSHLLTPRRVALAYVGIVFFSWVLALWPSTSSTVQALPLIVALPWSLLLLEGGSMPLVALFLAGILNAWILYRVLRARRPASRLLLPPAS